MFIKKKPYNPLRIRKLMAGDRISYAGLPDTSGQVVAISAIGNRRIAVVRWDNDPGIEMRYYETNLARINEEAQES